MAFGENHASFDDSFEYSIPREGYQQYRSELAYTLISLYRNCGREQARKSLSQARSTTPYQVSRHLHQNPDGFNMFPGEEYKVDPELNTRDGKAYGYYLSNEFYIGLAKEVRGLGGVGLAVGSDQGLDFLNMANLKEMYCIDIDPYTHIATQAYLEIGLRLRDALGRYPTTEEYVDMFEWSNLPITLSLIAAPSSRFTFPQREINWLTNIFFEKPILRYLQNKREHYGSNSWIGTDQNLQHTLEAYGQGKVHIIQGDIAGKIIKKLSQKVRDQGQEVTLIYISNAPVRDHESIEQFKKLPLAKASKVIFSDRLDFNLANVPVPSEFYGLMDWHMIVFQPLIEDGFLTKNYGCKFEEIAPGCYKAI